MGFSKAYYRYDLEFKFTSKETGCTFVFKDENFDNTLILDGEKKSFRTLVSIPDDIKPGKYTLSLRITEKRNPIKLAIKEELKENDGYYKVSEVTIL